VDPASLFSKWVGETEKALRQVFRKAKQAAPCILFFDGLEALVPVRSAHGDIDSGATERLATQFFAELDRVVEIGDVVVLGATNRPELVDPALIRPGRFGFTIRFRRPDVRQREEILAVHLRNVPLDDIDLSELARQLDGFSSADIAGLCQRAVIMEIERFAVACPDPEDRVHALQEFRLTGATVQRALEESFVSFAARGRETREEASDADLPGM
jgi:transitional endoplasmic reticulum ATPase